MAEVVKYNIGHGGQQVIKAPNKASKPTDKGRKVEGKDLRTGKGK